MAPCPDRKNTTRYAFCGDALRAFAPARSANLIGCALCVVLLLAATSVQAGTTWTGGGSGASWGTAGNWGGALPLFNGTETITIGTAFTSGTTLTLDGNRNIGSLLINTTSAFTIATGTSGSLDIFSGNITRQDVAGTEATQTISAGIVLGDPAGVAAYTGTWSIDGSNSLNVTGNISETGGVRGITKTGAGTLILSGTNSFSGGLTLNAGTVQISSDANLGASSGSLTFGGGTLKATTNIVGTRNIIMTGAGTFSIPFGNTLEESGAVSGNGNITVTGNGILILSGSGSNGTGTTTLSSADLSLRGTVSLGSGVLTFQSGILELGNSNFTRALGTGAGQVNMSFASGGAGFSAYGADRIVNLGGSGATVTWGLGNFVASGQPLYIGMPTADHMLDFQNGIDLAGATRTITVTAGTGTGADGKISGVISGTGTSNLVINSVGFAPWNPGTLILSNGNNSYAGTTTVNAGTLVLSANATGTAGNTVLGSGTSDVLVGNTSGANNTGLLTNGAFTISRNIRAQSGNFGTVTLGGNSADASTFSGNIFLGTASNFGKGVTLTAASGGTTTFSGVIQDPTGVFGPAQVTKAGAGTVVLSNANTYAGATTVSTGVLNIQNATALGTTASGTTISSGATLQLQGGITVGAEALTIRGTGAAGQNGALVNVSGTNNYGGLLVLGAATTISSDSGTLNLTNTGTITGATFGLTLTGSGSGTLSSIIGTGTGSLTKNGIGTWTLTGSNTYTGSTTINAGTLNVTGSLASGSAVTVNNSGSVLEGTGTIYGSVSIAANGAILEAGTGSTGQTLTMRGAVSLASGSVIALALGASGAHSTLAIGPGGSIVFQSLQKFNIIDLGVTDGSTYSGLITGIGSDPGTESGWTITNQSWAYNFSYDAANGGEIDLTVTAAPEPSTWCAAALAFGAVGYSQRRRFVRLLKRA